MKSKTHGFIGRVAVHHFTVDLGRKDVPLRAEAEGELVFFTSETVDIFKMSFLLSRG